MVEHRGFSGRVVDGGSGVAERLAIPTSGHRNTTPLRAVAEKESARAWALIRYMPGTGRTAATTVRG
jgi:hypothetical protein